MNRGRSHGLAVAWLCVALAGMTRPVLAEVGSTQSASAAPIVERVDLDLPAGEDPGAIRSLIAIEPGTPLSRAALRRAVERLHATGRLSAISIREHDLGAGRVALTLRAEERVVADKVIYRGAGPLSDVELEQAAELPKARVDVWPELLDKTKGRIREACARSGYPDAEVLSELRIVSGQKVLEFSLKLGSPTRINEAIIVGSPGLSEAEVLALVGMSPGEILDVDRMAAGLRRYRERLIEERYYRARVGTPEFKQGAQGISVYLPVNAGARMRLAFSGNRELSDAQLRGALAYTGEEPLDDAMLLELCERLTDLYQRAGFASARTTARLLRRSASGEQGVLFSIVEGMPLRVTRVAFDGNQHFSDEALRSELDGALADAIPESGVGASGFLARPSQVYYEPAYKEAIVRMLDLYRGTGYLGAFVTLAELDQDPEAGVARVRFHVREGPRTLIDKIQVRGGPVAYGAASEITLRQGAPHDAHAIEAARFEIEQKLGSQAYLFAKVKDQEEFSSDRSASTVTFQVETGPRVKVGRIIIVGAEATTPETIRAALAIKEGEWLDAVQLARSQQNLVKLGIFRTVRIRMSTPERPEEVKDLSVEVEERNSVLIMVGGGYSLQDGPRAFAEFTKLNLFGRAFQLQARAKVNYFNWSVPALTEPELYGRDGIDALGRRLSLSLVYPRLLALLPTEVGARVELIHERINRPSYGFDRTAAIAGLDFAWLDSMVFGSLQYEIETDRVDRSQASEDVELSPTDIERLRFDPGRIDLHSILASVNLDLRDSPTNPRRGAILGASAEVVQSLGGKVFDSEGNASTPFSFFLKTTGHAAGYVPIGGLVLSLSLRAGQIMPLDPEQRSQTIPPKRFFLGGASTMRGFLDDTMLPEDGRQSLHDQVAACRSVPSKCTAAALRVNNGLLVPSEGGQLFALARSELRIPLAGPLEGALFFDAGNLWADPKIAYGAFRLRTAAGAGLRVLTPIGPAAFDLGINLDPDTVLNESRFVPHFSIGFF